jgi:hypothetical protein
MPTGGAGEDREEEPLHQVLADVFIDGMMVIVPIGP